MVHLLELAYITESNQGYYYFLPVLRGVRISVFFCSLSFYLQLLLGDNSDLLREVTQLQNI